jgi:hypothetical protein
MYKILVNHSSIDIAEEYEVNFYLTIKELKSLILKKHNYSNMKLIFSGKILKDDFTLEYYDICEDNMIICMGKMFMNNTPNIRSVNPPSRANNPNNNSSINFPQLNRPNISSNSGSITLNVPINPFLNLTSSLSSITNNNGSITRGNNFIGLFTTTLHRDPVISSLTQSINNNPLFYSSTNSTPNINNFMNFFSQLGSITNISSTNLNNSNNPFSSFLDTLSNNNQNIDLNRPIIESDNNTYAYGIQELRNLGFYNNIHNINALKYTNNNINEAINILVNYA